MWAIQPAAAAAKERTETLWATTPTTKRPHKVGSRFSRHFPLRALPEAKLFSTCLSVVLVSYFYEAGDLHAFQK